MFSVSGPPIVIYLSQALKEKPAFRATLYEVFFVDACYRTVLLTANGLLNREVFRFALLMAPFLVGAVTAASWLQQFLHQKVFRRVIAGMLTVTGVMLLI
jgi:uncharacterized membrane protein YfcA